MNGKDQERDSNRLSAIDLLPLTKNPLVSVLISNYNYESFIGESIRSVLKQTYPNFELIICDDGSKDGSVEVIQTYLHDDRVRLIQKENGGQASAINAAYKAATGEIISLLDSDDTFHPRKLELVASAFAGAPSCGLCIHRVQPVSGEGRPIGPPYPRSLESGWIGPRALAEGAHSGSVPQTLGVSFRRQIADRLFPMPEQFRRSPDAHLVRAAFFITRIISLPEVLAYYRVHGDNIQGLFNTSTATRNTIIDDILMYTQTLRDFLTSTYDEVTANSLRAEDNLAYWNNLLAFYILEGKLGYDVKVNNVREIVEKLPKGRNRYIWWILVRIPRPIAKRIYQFWWGKSVLRNYSRKFLHWINW